MMEINVNVRCPDLLQAVTVLAAALKDSAVPKSQTAPSDAPATVPAPSQSIPAAAVPVSAPPAAVTPTATPAPVAVPGTAPAAPRVPVAPAPSITLDQLGKAGADLISADSTKMTELIALLQQFGVRAITELKPDQIGAFATALRGLGGKI